MSDEPNNALVQVPQAPQGQASPPQYMQGFEGVASAPFSDFVRKVLAEPVEDIDVEIKPDGIVYLPGVWWRRKLTKAFGPGGWAIVPRQPARVMNDLVIYPGALICLGRFVADSVGECAYVTSNKNMSYASCLEGAKTDAISRCCKDLGMGTELWDPAWRDGWMKRNARIDKWVEVKFGPKAGTKKPIWVRNDAKDRTVSEIDLMAGAGGQVPEAKKEETAAAPSPKEEPVEQATPAPSTKKARTKSAQGAAPSSPASDTSGTSAPPTKATSAASEVGQASQGEQVSLDEVNAKLEQQHALVTQFRRLQLKKGTVRFWVNHLFGVEDYDKLDIEQGDNAHALLCLLQPGDLGSDHIPEAYTRMCDNLKSNGKLVNA